VKCRITNFIVSWGLDISAPRHVVTSAKV